MAERFFRLQVANDIDASDRYVVEEYASLRGILVSTESFVAESACSLAMKVFSSLREDDQCYIIEKLIRLHEGYSELTNQEIEDFKTGLQIEILDISNLKLAIY